MQNAADERRVRCGVLLSGEIDRAEDGRRGGVVLVVGHPRHRLRVSELRGHRERDYPAEMSSNCRKHSHSVSLGATNCCWAHRGSCPDYGTLLKLQNTQPFASYLLW